MQEDFSVLELTDLQQYEHIKRHFPEDFLDPHHHHVCFQEGLKEKACACERKVGARMFSTAASRMVMVHYAV